MRTIIALALAFVLITGTEARADPVSLACSGMSKKTGGANQQTQDVVSIIVDIGANRLTVSGDLVPIVKVTEDAVAGKEDRPPGGSIEIDINRITGKISLSSRGLGPPPTNWSFDGMCKPAQKMF